MSGLLDYEKLNNVLIKKLQSQKDICKYIVQNDASILVPQNVTIENLSITRDLVETHVIINNPQNPNQWVSMNGVLGIFDNKGVNDVIHIISAAFHRESFNPLVDLKTLFATERSIFEEHQKNKPNDTPGIHVLRKGQLLLEGKSIVTIILIAEPLTYLGCEWQESKSPKQRRKSISQVPDSLSSSSASLLDSPIKEIINLNKSTRGKPKGLREFLTQFGNATGTNQPLFPDSPDTSLVMSSSSTSTVDEPIVNKRGSVILSQPSVASKTAAFYQKLKNPASVEFVKSLKIFINSFGYQPIESMTNQGQKVRSFLDNLESAILSHPLWKDATEDDQEGVTEGLEKYVTTQLYKNLFTSHVTEKEEEQLSNRMIQLQFITWEHLDIKPVFINEASLTLAANELKKINDYKAPRDKMICTLNCCKVIYNVLNKYSTEGNLGADEFLPLLIYVVLRANPQHLHTNLEFISHFRNPNKMISETGYYFTHLVSATHFIKTLDSSCLSIDPDEFQRNMQLNDPTSRRPASLLPSLSSSPHSESMYLLPRSQSMLDLNFEIPETKAESYTFINTNADDLKIGDIPTLLSEYKRLVEENKLYRELMKNIKGL